MESIRDRMLANKDLANKSEIYLDVRERLIRELFIPNPIPEEWERLNDKIKLWDSIHEVNWWDHESQ